MTDYTSIVDRVSKGKFSNHKTMIMSLWAIGPQENYYKALASGMYARESGDHSAKISNIIEKLATAILRDYVTRGEDFQDVDFFDLAALYVADLA